MTFSISHTTVLLLAVLLVAAPVLAHGSGGGGPRPPPRHHRPPRRSGFLPNRARRCNPTNTRDIAVLGDGATLADFPAANTVSVRCVSFGLRPNKARMLSADAATLKRCVPKVHTLNIVMQWNATVGGVMTLQTAPISALINGSINSMTFRFGAVPRAAKLTVQYAHTTACPVIVSFSARVVSDHSATLPAGALYPAFPVLTAISPRVAFAGKATTLTFKRTPGATGGEKFAAVVATASCASDASTSTLSASPAASAAGELKWTVTLPASTSAYRLCMTAANMTGYADITSVKAFGTNPAYFEAFASLSTPVVTQTASPGTPATPAPTSSDDDDDDDDEYDEGDYDDDDDDRRLAAPQPSITFVFTGATLDATNDKLKLVTFAAVCSDAQAALGTVTVSGFKTIDATTAVAKVSFFSETMASVCYYSSSASSWTAVPYRATMSRGESETTTLVAVPTTSFQGTIESFPTLAPSAVCLTAPIKSGTAIATTSEVLQLTLTATALPHNFAADLATFLCLPKTTIHIYSIKAATASTLRVVAGVRCTEGVCYGPERMDAVVLAVAQRNAAMTRLRISGASLVKFSGFTAANQNGEKRPTADTSTAWIIVVVVMVVVIVVGTVVAILLVRRHRHIAAAAAAAVQVPTAEPIDMDDLEAQRPTPAEGEGVVQGVVFHQVSGATADKAAMKLKNVWEAPTVPVDPEQREEDPEV
jgi:hypothetical protein